MLMHDSGPFGFLDKTRVAVGADKQWEDASELGRLLQCPYCTSVWVAAAMYGLVVLWPSVFWPVSYIFAASGVASLIEELK